MPQDKYNNESPEVSLTVAVGEAEQSDEQMYSEMAPAGRYSAKALNNLVKATNRLLPLFDQDPSYPEFTSDLDGQLPTDFVRVLAMFQGAINAAVDFEVVDAEMDFLMEDLTDDELLNMLAGKLTSLAQNREFKQFLRNPPMMEEEEEEEMTSGAETAMEGEEMTDEQMDSLFASRM
jgi:hypothetical protein